MTRGRKERRVRDRKENFLRMLRAKRERNQISKVSWQEQIQASYVSRVEFVREDTKYLGLFGAREMDDAVWSKGLPDDVFCMILACLPLTSLFRMRCVCKKWCFIADDPAFVNASARLRPQEPLLFLTSKDGPCWAYECAQNSWRRIPPSFFFPRTTEGRVSLVTAAGGRLLFIRSSPLYSLMVYNPLNKTGRVMPQMFDMSGNLGLPTASEIHVVGMYTDTVRDYFNILVVDRRTNKLVEDPDDSDDDEFELEPITSQVYDSRSGAWDMMEIFDPQYELRMLNAALFAGALRSLTIAYQPAPAYWDRPVVDELSVYKVLREGWEYETLKIPTQDLPIVSAHIFSSRGKPMLAAAVPIQRTRYHPYPKWMKIIIWELEMVDMVEDKWVKMGEIDLQRLPRGTFVVSLNSFVFLSEGDSLYFGSNTGSTLGVVNLQTKLWRILPTFPGYVPHTGVDPPLNPKKFQTFVYGPRFDLVA